MIEDTLELLPPKMLEFASAIVEAYVSKNAVPGAELAAVIKSVHGTLSGLASGQTIAGEHPKPAVPIRKSVTADYIVCLEDGTKLKMLKRYLRSRYDLTPDQYRVKWGLPADYPMVAPNYSERRSQFAKKIGLGRTLKAPRKYKRG